MKAKVREFIINSLAKVAAFNKEKVLGGAFSRQTLWNFTKNRWQLPVWIFLYCCSACHRLARDGRSRYLDAEDTGWISTVRTRGHCPFLCTERIRVISLIREDQTPGLSLQSSNCSVVYCSKIKLQAGGVQHTAVRAISTLGCVQIISAGIWPRLCRRDLG